jgi:hypothetical protein
MAYDPVRASVIGEMAGVIFGLVGAVVVVPYLGTALARAFGSTTSVVGVRAAEWGALGLAAAIAIAIAVLKPLPIPLAIVLLAAATAIAVADRGR